MLGDLLDILSLFFGLFLTIFHKAVGTKTAKFRENFLSFIPPKVKYSKKDIQLTQYLFLLGGVIIVIISLLEIFGVIRLK